MKPDRPIPRRVKAARRRKLGEGPPSPSTRKRRGALGSLAKLSPIGMIGSLFRKKDK
jgi:hypothetical protein